MPDEELLQKPAGCSLFRRMLILLYDAIVVMALWFASTGLWLPANRGEAITFGHPLWPFYIFSLIIVWWFYLALSWRRGGQTLGMRAWRVQLQTGTGQVISWPVTVIRFAVAIGGTLPAGLGQLWSLFRPDRAAWQDLASDSRLIVLPKR